MVQGARRVVITRRRPARKTAVSLLSAALLALALFGCVDSTSTETDADSRATAPPTRIVVLSPALADILVRLRLGPLVVGRGEAGPWPADIAELPSVGRFDRPDLEVTLQLRATHIVTTETVAADDALARLADVGLTIVELDTATLDGALSAVDALGARFDHTERASALRASIEAELDAARSRAAELPRISLVAVVGREPLFVAGPGSHIDELASIAGGDNVFDDLSSPYAQVSLEALVDRRPDLVLEIGEADTNYWIRMLGPGVRVVGVPAVDISVPDSRLGQMAERLVDRLHPHVAPSRPGAEPTNGG